MSAAYKAPIFTDENAAREALEWVRWPKGPVCVHCGAADHMARVEGTKKSHRPGLLYCNDCKGQFTVTVGTVFERSKIPLTKWWMATHLLCSSKKGISSHQVHRTLGVTYKTAWFMTHRIREAMKSPGGLLGGGGKTVEADETYLSKSTKTRKPAGLAFNAKPATQVFALVERGAAIRSMHLDYKNIRGALREHLDDKSRLVTDGAQTYKFVMPTKELHESVDNSKFEWVRGDVHTNAREPFQPV